MCPLLTMRIVDVYGIQLPNTNISDNDFCTLYCVNKLLVDYEIVGTLIVFSSDLTSNVLYESSY